MALGATLMYNPTYAQEILDCQGSTHQQADLLTKTAVFNVVGINLNRYDWSEPVVNCHINNTITTYNDSKFMGKIAATVAGVGLGLLATGIIQKSYGGGPFDVGSGGNTSIVLGSIITGGSIPLFGLSIKKRKKSNTHLNQVSTYFRKKGLF